MILLNDIEIDPDNYFFDYNPINSLVFIPKLLIKIGIVVYPFENLSSY